jgi:hypothetical protein
MCCLCICFHVYVIFLIGNGLRAWCILYKLYSTGKLCVAVTLVVRNLHCVLVLSFSLLFCVSP